MSWVTFFSTLAALWAFSIVLIWPHALDVYHRETGVDIDSRIEGSIIFWVSLVIAPFYLGELLARTTR
jgi:hypothetical protein